MSIGTNIRFYREKLRLTQEKLADRLDVSFQAVSSWERDEYLPETTNLIRIAEELGVSLSALVEEHKDPLEAKEALFDWEHMEAYVKRIARQKGMKETLAAVAYAKEAHQGQTRKRSKVPYFYHPLNLACHALAMGIDDDAIIAGCLLHDVIEDCGKTLAELPVSDETREIVRLMSHEKTTDENREELMNSYYSALAENPKAALVKCLDRCNNLTTMSWGLSRERMIRMINETEKYYPKLLNVLKDTPEYNNAHWLLRYQIESMLDIYIRLM